MTVISYGTFSTYRPSDFESLVPPVAPVNPNLEGAERDAAVHAQHLALAQRQAIIDHLTRNVHFIRNGDGQDLYELRKTMPETGSFVTLNDDGTIRIVGTDRHKVWPSDNGSLYWVDADLATFGLEGHGFDPATGMVLPAPPRPVLAVTSAQAKVALYRTKRLDDGSLTQEILPYGERLSDLLATALAAYPGDVRLWYDTAALWEREHPYLLGLALELGLSTQQVDALFAYAARLDS